MPRRSLGADRGQDRWILLVYPGLLARYDQMELLAKLQAQVTHGHRLKSCWSHIGKRSATVFRKPNTSRSTSGSTNS
jgi:hypothetical protein